MLPLRLTAQERHARANQERDFLSRWPAYPLQPAARRAARQANRNAQARLRTLWDLWSQQSQQNPQLRQTLLQVQIVHDMHYFIFFHLGRLPAEIITNIFRFVAWSTSNPDESVSARVGLTHVCRQWRAIALEDQTLWSAIWFRDKFPFSRSLTFIERARNTPLDIRIQDLTETDTMDDEQMNYVLDRLFQKVGSIRMLIILCYRWEPVLTVLKRLHQAIRAGTPLILQRFDLHRLGDPYLWPGSSFTPVGHSVTKYPMIGGPLVPRLTYLSVNAIHFDWGASTIRNLTTIDIRRLPLNRAVESSVFRSMLTNCPRVEKLALDGAGPSGPPSGQNQTAPVQLNHLKILVLANFTPIFVQNIAAHFSAPNVLDLTVMNLFGREYTHLYVFLTGRFPRVRIFTMYTLQVAVGMGHTAMIKFLASMPEVRYLRIAVMEAYGLSTFLYDPKTLEPHRLPPYARDLFRRAGAPYMTTADHPPEDDERPTAEAKTYIFPQLTVVEAQCIRKEWLEIWCASRKAIGLPLHTLYLQGNLKNLKYTQDDFARLNTHVTRLAMIALEQATPEEQTSLA